MPFIYVLKYFKILNVNVECIFKMKNTLNKPFFLLIEEPMINKFESCLSIVCNMFFNRPSHLASGLSVSKRKLPCQSQETSFQENTFEDSEPMYLMKFYCNLSVYSSHVVKHIGVLLKKSKRVIGKKEKN